MTTQDPGNRDNLKTVQVVIGGDGAWLNELAGGIAPVGAFYNKQPNVAFVFPGALGNGDPKPVALAAIHEAGHTFGLEHQSVWAGQRLQEEYNPGTAQLAPIMGSNYYSTRNAWWKGTSINGPESIQDDLAVLSNSKNGFGLRADDYANTTDSATPLKHGEQKVGGVIETSDDADVFTFTHPGGYVQIIAEAAPLGAMLFPRVELIDTGGRVLKTLARADFNQVFAGKLVAGTYYLRISGDGDYGSIGQYTLSVARGSPPPAAPSGVDVDGRSSSEMRISWKDNSRNERGFIIERSEDGITWERWRLMPADATEAFDSGLRPETVYYYRVQAYNRTGRSKMSAPPAGGKTRPQPLDLVR